MILLSAYYESGILGAVANTTAAESENAIGGSSMSKGRMVAEMVTFQKSVTATTLAVYTRQHLCELIQSTAKFLVDKETRTRWWNSEALRKQNSWSASKQFWQARASPCTKFHRRQEACMEGPRPISCRTTFTTISDFRPSVQASISSLP